MSIPYMPLYIADYEADTAHLNPEEDGIYTRLLRLCWRTPGCSVPDDPEWLSRMLRVSPEYLAEKVQPIVSEFFKREKARLFSKRQQEIFDRINATSRARSDAGKKGGRPLKSHEKSKSPAQSKTKANGKHLELDIDIKKEGGIFPSSQKDPSAPPAYPWEPGISYGENHIRKMLWDWAKTRTRPTSTTPIVPSGHLKAMAKILDPADLAWLSRQLERTDA
jgi:uncharacterized protein YdaU (DUF1376 family)